ncbi:MAG TPA: aromatic acid exporter family protein [Bacillota bacterium]
MKEIFFPGGRIVKTAVAIFLTAWICQLFDWPPVFAVITAIVTIEPTVADSIRKGIIRFPASAIGAAYAVLFISLFGNSPITYTLAAFFTIATCYKLHLHAGLVVATLTAVAMIEVIHSNYVIAFFIRLGTTTIGLVVSTVVNLFVLPPNYKDDILTNIRGIRKKTGVVIEKVFTDILHNKHDEDAVDRKLMDQLNKKVQQTETLARFQQDEAKFHPLIDHERKLFHRMKQSLTHLQLILYHLDNLINTSIKQISWTEEERKIVIKAVHSLANNMKNKDNFDPAHHDRQRDLLMKLFWEDNEEMIRRNGKHPTRFPPELIILYELLAIYNVVLKLYEPKEKNE